MKKNLFLLMALAGAMVVMPGCSNDDDNGEGGGKNPVYRKITGFTIEKSPINVFGQTVTPKRSEVYTYDEAGKVTRMDLTNVSASENTTGFTQYAYSASKVDVTGETTSSFGSNAIQPAEYPLSKGNATAINLGETDRYEASTEAVEYDNAGYLAKITIDKDTDYEQSFTFTFMNGNLDKLVKFKKSNSRQDTYTFTYGKFENKGSIDLFAFLGSDWNLFTEHCNMFLLGVGGKRSAKLPVQVSWVVDWLDDEDPAESAEVTDYAYQTSTNGYVLQYTNGEKDDSGELIKFKITYAE